MRQMENCGSPEEKWTKALNEEKGSGQEMRGGRRDGPAFFVGGQWCTGCVTGTDKRRG